MVTWRDVAMLVAGAVLAEVFAALARGAGPRRALRMHAAALVIAGLAYVAFALAAGDAAGLVVEAGGTAILLALAAIGYRRGSARIFAPAWALHPLWDVGLHTLGRGEYAPLAYVVVCIGFDLLLAARLVSGRAGIPASPASAPA